LNHKESTNNKVAEKNFEPSDYTSNSALNKGLAVTHEQVSDTWAEGNSDAVIDDLDGENVKIQRKGYQK
jgi:hypothetical protein